jgi:excisionase family DNA binding protein
MVDMSDTERYYSVTKVAEMLPVSRQMVVKMYHAGKFPNAIRYGKAIRIPESDVRNAASTRAYELKRQAIEWEMVAA